jgi:hypothetical protein
LKLSEVHPGGRRAREPAAAARGPARTQRRAAHRPGLRLRLICKSWWLPRARGSCVLSRMASVAASPSTVTRARGRPPGRPGPGARAGPGAGHGTGRDRDPRMARTALAAFPTIVTSESIWRYIDSFPPAPALARAAGPRKGPGAGPPGKELYTTGQPSRCRRHRHHHSRRHRHHHSRRHRHHHSRVPPTRHPPGPGPAPQRHRT